MLLFYNTMLIKNDVLINPAKTLSLNQSLCSCERCVTSDTALGASEGPYRCASHCPRLAAPTVPEARVPLRPLTSTLEEVAVDILDGGVDGGPGGDTSRSDVWVILGIYVLKSFPWNSRMEFWGPVDAGAI